MKQERMTAKQFQNMNGKKSNKYNAKKAHIDGYTFDSKREARHYNVLKLQKEFGEIQDFDLQPEFILQDKFRKNGKTVRAIKYIGDFRVHHNDGSIEIIDVKSRSTTTQVYRLKKKMFEYHYPDLTIKEIY